MTRHGFTSRDFLAAAVILLLGVASIFGAWGAVILLAMGN
jgi:hypothetical protein